MDANLRDFNATVPMLAQWDDHEVTNNWWPEEPLTRAQHQRLKYNEKFALPMVARAARAFHEFMPVRPQAEPARLYRKISYGPMLDIFMIDMRSYRGPNGENKEAAYGPDSHFLGPDQIAWLKRELKASRATWKVIAADMPISLYVVYDGDRKWGSEAVAQGDPGKPLGREFEIANILSFIKREGVRNTVWLTADVHYTAAHYYDPGKAQFQEFDPFWEFVSGPIHAGTFGPGDLDATFGPQLMYVKAPSKEQGQNLPPSAGLQFFGQVQIDPNTEQMTVTLRDVADTVLWSKTLDPVKG
jgi:alkaline phosphatase D